MQTGLPLTLGGGGGGGGGGHPLYKPQWSMCTCQFLFELHPSFAFISREAGRVYMLGWGKYYQEYIHST